MRPHELKEADGRCKESKKRRRLRVLSPERGIDMQEKYCSLVVFGEKK